MTKRAIKISARPNVNGRKDNHIKYMRLSYRIRGKVPRAHKKNIVIRIVFIIKMRLNLLGEKRRTENIDITTILVYSAIKINANGPALYSILNPDTSSDSPSIKSYGVRFVSARIVASQMGKKIGHKKIGHIINLKEQDRDNEFITIKAKSMQRDIPTS